MCCLIYKFLLILTQKMQISFLKILPENALKFVSKKMRICVKNFAQLQIESILFCSDGFYMSYGRKVYKYIALQDFNFEYARKVYAWMKVASRDKASDKRHKIIRKLEELLRLTDENVKGLEYIEEKDTIIIHYTDKSSSLVNVALDSGIALIKDVVGMI